MLFLLFRMNALTYKLAVMGFEFAEYVNTAISRAGSAANLARQWDVSEMQVSRWQIGQDIRLTTFVRLLNKIGGDIWRSFPEYTPTINGKAQTRTISLQGQVAASPMDIPGDGHGEIDAPLAAWESNPLCTFCHGPVFCLEVYGESMQPAYQHGEYIACRLFNGNPRTLPDATPAILLEDGRTTFKMLRRIGDLQFGQPLNTSYPLVKLGAPASVQSIVLGKFTVTHQAKKQAKYSGLPSPPNPEPHTNAKPSEFALEKHF